MMRLRRAAERGYFDHGWLKTFHTFSFGEYYDPRHMNFRALRVINEDFIAPAAGFGTHAHRDMEIITVILEGELAHKDSMGTASVIRTGEVQRMSAGSGVTHSEYNASDKSPVHLLQIWCLPEKRSLTPEYEQKSFLAEIGRNRLCTVVSPTGSEGSLRIHADVTLRLAKLDGGKTIQAQIAGGRHVWVHMAGGEALVSGQALGPGDGAAISGENGISIEGVRDAEVLVFDLA